MVQFPLEMRSGGRFGFCFRWASLILAICFLPCLASAMDGGADKKENALQSISIEKVDGLPSVQIKTEKPVGYRYTVYDSYDPIRVVIDFPGVDVSAVKSPIDVAVPPLQEIRTGSLDLASGSLGRVELLLTREAKYKVNSAENLFSVSFAEPSSAAAGKAAEEPTAVAGKAAAEEKPPVPEEKKTALQEPAKPMAAAAGGASGPGNRIDPGTTRAGCACGRRQGWQVPVFSSEFTAASGARCLRGKTGVQGTLL